MPEIDPLAALEGKIAKALDTIARLKSERDEAIAGRDEALAKNEKLETERAEVRTRIEKLLARVDLLSSEP
jgi:FtsZ-binding cell division protein ZapB